MPTLMPTDTTKALGDRAQRCDSRSLFLDRFAEPTAKDLGDKHPRRDWFTALLGKPATPGVSTAKCHWLTAPPFSQNATLLYAQLQSRLMLNMAGGVMENAGLCLDRFGLPYIPGSAVKGCARRAALAALHEWCESNQKPGAADADRDNPLKHACAPFDTAADMLTAIAHVFGWCEQDWKPNADFFWAANGKNEILSEATHELASAFGWSIDEKHQHTPWKSLRNFAGSISFLPAYPVDLGKTPKLEGLPLEAPQLGKLELDVVTCHHRDYYDGKLPIATDTEDPVPVVFPAVAPGHVFLFALAPLRGADAPLVRHARAWLATGLSVFGLGAKTNAGYGWFEASDAIDIAVRQMIAQQAERERAEEQRQAEERRRRREEEERVRKAREVKAAIGDMTPEQRADFELAQLTADQFRSRLDQFLKRDKAEQEAVVRALRLPPDAASSRRQFWEDLKQKARRGGKPAQIEQAIRQLNKAMNLGKMP